jgi:hypothetical protein
VDQVKEGTMSDPMCGLVVFLIIVADVAITRWIEREKK